MVIRDRKDSSGDQVRAARISAISALIGAIVGLLGGSVPALITSESESNRAKADFLRSEQREAYWTFLATEHRLVQAYSPLAPDKIPPDEGSSGRLERDRSIKDAWHEFQRSFNNLELIGAATSRQKAEALYDEHLVIYVMVVYRCLGGPRPRKLEVVCDYRANFDPASEDADLLDGLNDLRSEFLDSARADLGSGAPPSR